MTPVLTVELHQNQAWLTSNQRLHWAKRAELTRYWRQMTHAATRNPRKPLNRAHIVVTFHKPTKHRYDPANLYPTVKACVDGLVDAGVIPDDDHTHLIGPDMRAGEPGPRRIVIAVYDASEAP